MDSELEDFTQNSLETLKISKVLSITSYYNNETINRLYLSRVNTIKWVLEQSNDDNNNNLDKLESIILFKIQKLKKEKKRSVYRSEIIRIIQEIDNLEFCLNALVQDINNIITLAKEFLSIIFY
ncbi:MAG TPA: hypothetical protein VJU85_04180 [Nitrososphaeraceae archaeon]|nr:hypothetical protein [Nitrososphaeraceae archaeon]